MSKKLSMLLLLLVLFLINIDTAYAAHVSSNPPYTSNSGVVDTGQPKELGYDTSGNRYVCKYNQKVTKDVEIEINAYDLSGTSLIPYSFKPSNTVKAGTWVGINANEYKSSGWMVSSFEYYEVFKEVTCTYHYDAQYKTETKWVTSIVPENVCICTLKCLCGTARYAGALR